MKDAAAEKLTPNFTQVPNVLFDEWLTRLSDVELRVLMVVIRQTFGWVDAPTGRRKTEDWLSQSYIMEKTGRGRARISVAIKRLVDELHLLEAVNSKGKHLDAPDRKSNFGKIFYRSTLRVPELSLFDAVSKKKTRRVHFLGTQKVDTTKESSLTKETPILPPPPATDGKIPLTPQGADVLKAFEVVDAKNKTYYNRRPIREACEFLLQEYGMDQVLKVISGLPMTNKMPYFPNITTPLQLKENWVRLHDKVAQYRIEKQGKKTLVV